MYFYSILYRFLNLLKKYLLCANIHISQISQTGSDEAQPSKFQIFEYESNLKVS